MSLPNVLAVTSPVVAAAAALGGSFLGSRATLRAHREDADRHDAREEREHQSELRATARLIHLELTETLSLLEVSRATGYRMLVGRHTTVEWERHRGTVARIDHPTLWGHLVTAYLVLDATRGLKGPEADLLSEEDLQMLKTAQSTVKRAVDTLATLSGATPMSEERIPAIGTLADLVKPQPAPEDGPTG